MEPIISPWVFYLAGLSESLGVGAIISAIGVFIVTIMLVMETRNEEKWAIISGLITAFLVLIAIVLPSTETVYKMIAASYVTPDNVGAAVEGAVAVEKALVRDAISIIQAIANGVAN